MTEKKSTVDMQQKMGIPSTIGEFDRMVKIDVSHVEPLDLGEFPILPEWTVNREPEILPSKTWKAASSKPSALEIVARNQIVDAELQLGHSLEREAKVSGVVFSHEGREYLAVQKPEKGRYMIIPAVDAVPHELARAPKLAR